MMCTMISGVSFLVCTHNGAVRLASSLRALARQAGAADIAWEVVLVDNASTDDTTRIAAAVWERAGNVAPLQLLREPRPGKNFALARAFEQARYCYACIVDDDNCLDPNYLAIGYALLAANPQTGILGGQSSGSFPQAPPLWFPAFGHAYAVGEQLDYEHGQGKPLTDGPVGRNALWGAGMFVRTEIVVRLRQLSFTSLFTGRQGSTHLVAGEDYELCYAAQLLGYEIWYSSQLRLDHCVTAARLTTTYRDELFYASAWVQWRLQAYRNALRSVSEQDFSRPVALAIDFAYAVQGTVRRVMSARFAKALLRRDGLYLMETKRQLLIIYDFVRHYPTIRGSYQVVAGLKVRIAAVPPRIVPCVMRQKSKFTRPTALNFALCALLLLEQ